jgi:hypothetical protein
MIIGAFLLFLAIVGVIRAIDLYIIFTREPFPFGRPCVPEGREKTDPWSEDYQNGSL